MKFETHLRQLCRDIFEAAFDPDICGFATINDLASRAGLSWKTVDNLYRKKTKEPRHSTVWKLCRAVKMDAKLAREALSRR